MTDARKRLLGLGEAAPWFKARSTNNPVFNFSSAGGRYLVLVFFQSAALPESRILLEGFKACDDLFDDHQAAFFGVSVDPEDEVSGRVQQRLPGYRHFWDFDGRISRLYGALPDPSVGDLLAPTYRRHVLLLDPMLRVVSAHPLKQGPERIVELIQQQLGSMPRIDDEGMASLQAPVLLLPRIFEEDLCRRLIEHYEEFGGSESGYMVEKDGMTVGRIDPKMKRRYDLHIEDEKLRHACMVRIHDRLIPQIFKAFQVPVRHMERYIVACYDAGTGGYFKPHRDNGSRGTAHRQFAVTLNLNSADYDGGDLKFPEFGQALYRPPTGGAVVFSCSLLHEARPVKRGRRYAFLPFLYDAEHARIRRENMKYIARDEDYE